MILMDRKIISPFRKNFKIWSKTLREILYGMTVHEMDLELRKEKGNLEHLFTLVVF